MKGRSTILLVFCVVTGSLAKSPPTFLEYKDSLGRYSFGYSAPASARSEVRSLDGSTRGSYSYVDDAGVIQSAQYTADGEHGFRVVATNLPKAPKPVEDTPEVAAARLDHLRAVEEATKLVGKNRDAEYFPSVARLDENAFDSVAIDGGLKSAEKPDENRIETKSNREAAAEMSAGSQVEGKEEIAKGALEIGGADDEDALALIKENSVQSESLTVKSLSRVADFGRTNVPVVTTSFVIPGRVNLHSRIELDQSGVAVARFSPEPFSARLAPLQSSMPQGQGDEFDPSLRMPAGTATTTIAGSEKSAIPNESSRRPAGAAEAATSIQHQYRGTITPIVVAPQSIYGLPYAIGVDPILRQYNPHRYFRYGIL